MSPDKRSLRRAAASAVTLGVMFVIGQCPPAAAFPLLDPSNQSTLPGNVTDLAAPDAQDLQHQIQIANGFAAPAGGGWTILPRITFEGIFNDNEGQVAKPRRPDFMTLVSPAVAIAADLPRLQLKLDYAPAVEMNVPDGPQNAVIQQLNGTALVTVIPDLAFVDVRAMAGVQAIDGLVGANGSAGNVGEIGSGTGLSGGSTTVGLPKQNRTQTSSIVVSPYLMDTFGDWGTGKLGTSFTATAQDQTNGFLAAPFPTGGGNGSTGLTLEQTGQFTTGSALSAWQNTVSFDLTQTNTTINQVVTETGDTAAIPRRTISSQRAIASDKLSYAVTHWAQAFVTFGHEDINYSNASFRRIDDLIWNVGISAEPDPDSQVTVSYGHQNGSNSIQASGRYALSARTVISGSYTETLGTELEQIGQQLQVGVIGPNGQFIDGANGTPLLFNVYQLEVVPDVFRYQTFTLTAQTILDRDMFTLMAVISKQTSAGGEIQSEANTKSATLQWRHDLSPDLSLSTYAAYTTEVTAGGRFCFGTLSSVCAGGPATLESLVLGASLNYTITETLTANLRYLFNDRISSVGTQSMYQDLIIVGLTRRF